MAEPMRARTILAPAAIITLAGAARCFGAGLFGVPVSLGLLGEISPSSGSEVAPLGAAGPAWTGAGGGDWNDPRNWSLGVVPARGSVVVRPKDGGIITGPVDIARVSSLALGGEHGQTILDLRAGSAVIVGSPVVIPGDGGISGLGTFACDSRITNLGDIVMDDLSIVASGGVINGSAGDIAVAQGFISGGVVNSGLIDITPDAPGASGAALDVDGALSNEASGVVYFRNGVADCSATAGIFNSGRIGITNADATIFGDTTNVGAPDGLGGYTPVGGIDVVAGSIAIFTGDVVNQSGITVDSTSAIGILGTLIGNGIAGPAGPGSGGSVYLIGGVSPGFASGFSPGIARFDGDLNLGDDSVTTIEIGGTTPGQSHDQVVVAGVLSGAGIIRFTVAPGYAPQPGSVYRVLDFGGAIGSFAAVEFDPALVALGGDASTVLMDGNLRLLAPVCAGDVSGDGFTNSADFNVLSGNFGGSVPPNTGGDLNGDGVVNAADFNILAGDFGCGG